MPRILGDRRFTVCMLAVVVDGETHIHHEALSQAIAMAIASKLVAKGIDAYVTAADYDGDLLWHEVHDEPELVMVPFALQALADSGYDPDDEYVDRVVSEIRSDIAKTTADEEGVTADDVAELRSAVDGIGEVIANIEAAADSMEAAQ